MATDEVVLHGTIRLDSKIRSENVHFHDSFWREQTLAATRIDFAVAVSSRAVRISRRAVRVFPALSLRRVRPSCGTFSLMVFQGNCARGRTGHMIIPVFFRTTLLNEQILNQICCFQFFYLSHNLLDVLINLI